MTSDTYKTLGGEGWPASDVAEAPEIRKSGNASLQDHARAVQEHAGNMQINWHASGSAGSLDVPHLPGENNYPIGIAMVVQPSDTAERGRMPMSIIETLLRAKAEAAVCPAPEYIGQPYRPGSGTEGMSFDEHWCDHCTRDKAYRDGGPDADPAIGCQIIADTFAFEITDPRYPKEWVYGRDGRPCCTAFTTDPKCPVRCDKTIDLFDR